MLVATEFENCRHFEPMAAGVACGGRVRDLAVDLGISESAAYHVSGSPEFKRRVAEIRTEATAAALGRLTDAATLAVETLIELVDKSQKPEVRLRAADKILASLGSIGALSELRDRIAAMEPKQ